ncbi:hypothetical protein ACH4U5_03595 [Streptomyces sp. NPDC020858]|uniref:hypothetical protein n=1 Tax=Streptomyces sp. NPDC020858 TaxID=3365097 RepID=UPI0037B50D51
MLRTSAVAMEEIGQSCRTDDGRLDDMIEDAASQLDRIQNQKHSLTHPEGRSAAPTLQGTLLTDAARLLAGLRSGRRALSQT